MNLTCTRCLSRHMYVHTYRRTYVCTYIRMYMCASGTLLSPSVPPSLCPSLPPLQTWMSAPPSSTPAPTYATTPWAHTPVPVAKVSVCWRTATPAMVGCHGSDLHIGLVIMYCMYACYIFTSPVHADTDECTLGEHSCVHFCVNTIGNYHCLCRSGYEISEDEYSCRGTLYMFIHSCCYTYVTCNNTLVNVLHRIL